MPYIRVQRHPSRAPRALQARALARGAGGRRGERALEPVLTGLALGDGGAAGARAARCL